MKNTRRFALGLVTAISTVTIATLVATLALPAHADKHERDHERASKQARAPMPAAYLTECASCHAAFPRNSLNTAEWQQVLAGLEKHYGDSASLDAAPLKPIAEYLVGPQATSPQVGAGKTAMAAGTELPRLTKTGWFTREHREVPAALWKDPAIKSAANCAGCHPDAGRGGYNERDIRLPGGKRWED